MSDSGAVSGGTDDDGDDRASRVRDRLVGELARRRTKKGVPDMLHAELKQGNVPMRIRMRGPRGELVPVEPLQAHLSFTDFGRCPICLSRDGLTVSS